MDKVQVTLPNQNPKKIPEALFIENSEEFILKHTAERVMESLQEIYNKYKVMEMQIAKSKLNMCDKIPEIEKALEIIEFLDKKKEKDFSIDFLLTDTIYSKAKISKETKCVNLWLGANTMVEFTYAEAQKLLKKNLENAKSNLKTFEEDLVFLKDQITTCEVNIARVYNSNLKLIQQGKVKDTRPIKNN